MILCKVIKHGFSFMIFAIIILIVGCSKNVEINNENKMYSDLLEKIKIEVINESILPDGIGYAFKLRNESENLIVQNSVYVSFPITNIEKSRFLMNKCKVETSGNRVNIKPGEEVFLRAFIPKENFQDNMLICSEKPQLEIKGYLNNITEMNHFEVSGDINYFDNNFKTRFERRTEINLMIEQKLKIICTHSISSNPYKYIEKHKKEYNHILDQGNIALEFMLEKLKNSKEDGLKEYIMAIACSEILEEESENKNWSTGLEWYRAYMIEKNEGKKK